VKKIKLLQSIGLAVALAAWMPFLMAQEGGHQPAGQHGETTGHGGEGEHDNTTMWKFATFAVLAGALGYAIGKNAGPFFRGRTAEIQKGIQESKRMREQAEARAAEMESRLSNLSAEIDNLRKSARTEAEAEAQRIRQETQRDLARVQELAEQEIESASKAAQIALRNHAATLAVNLARQKAEARMSDSNQDNLVRAFVESAGRNSAAMKSAE
jgi:F-type H+-transporting ATPase subunit b